MQRCLMVGCGRGLIKRRIHTPYSCPDEEVEWETLDISDSIGIEGKRPTYIFDLNRLEAGEDLPGSDYHEIHVYDTLEHFGVQGDYKGFFNTWKAFWKALKPNGTVCGAVPTGDIHGLYGDPGHTRMFHPKAFNYLTESHQNDPYCSDYRKFIHPYWWHKPTTHTQEGSFRCLFAVRRREIGEEEAV